MSRYSWRVENMSTQSTIGKENRRHSRSGKYNVPYSQFIYSRSAITSSAVTISYISANFISGGKECHYIFNKSRMGIERRMRAHGDKS